MINKLLNKLIELFRRDRKIEAIQPRPKVKRQNVVPALRNSDNKIHTGVPKKHTTDTKANESKKKNAETGIADVKKPGKKKKYYRLKNLKSKKLTPAQDKNKPLS